MEHKPWKLSTLSFSHLFISIVISFYILKNLKYRTFLKHSSSWARKKSSCFLLESSTPQHILTLSTPPMDFLDPIRRSADSTATPVKWSYTDVACLRLPLAVCIIKTIKTSCKYIKAFTSSLELMYDYVISVLRMD